MIGHTPLITLSSPIGGLSLLRSPRRIWTHQTATTSDSSFLIAPGVGSGYDIGSGATGFVVFLTGAGLPYLELLGPLAEWVVNFGLYFLWNFESEIAFWHSGRVEESRADKYFQLFGAGTSVYLFGVLATGESAKIAHGALLGGKMTKTRRLLKERLWEKPSPRTALM